MNCIMEELIKLGFIKIYRDQYEYDKLILVLWSSGIDFYDGSGWICYYYEKGIDINNIKNKVRSIKLKKLLNV